jgi:hypothetical protein
MLQVAKLGVGNQIPIVFPFLGVHLALPLIQGALLEKMRLNIRYEAQRKQLG